MARRVRGEEPELTGGAPPIDVGASAHYEDPEYYDFAYRDRRDDVAYYARLARLSGGPVLEYGVGTGRIAVELCRAGIDVTGVDASAPMLAALERRFAREPESVRRRMHAVRGDMRTARVAGEFPLVIAAFNTILHLTERSDFERFFSGVRHHLSPRGRFVFDFSVPHADYLGADPQRTYGAPRFRHPKSGLVRYRERFEYDSFRQVLLMELHFLPESGEAPWVVPLTHRQLFPREVEALLHYNGFSDIHWTADFTDAPPEQGADSLVVSCRAVADAAHGKIRRPRQPRRTKRRA
ncbi:MAG TPA: class I SAM-dependent methyltransferase [Polyangiaceae bacterium]|nr:class I SAM-dependent methyltransferase [Polyangiaceae bacterium]